MVCTYCGAHRNESDKTCSVCGADFTQLNSAGNSQSQNTFTDAFEFDDIFSNEEQNNEMSNEEITTFEDLFGDEEIITFDDLFGQDVSKNDEEITTFDELFGQDNAKADEEIVAFDDLFAQDNAKADEEIVAFEDLFGQNDTTKNDEADDEIVTFEELFEKPVEKSEEENAFNMSLDDLDSIQDMLSANVDKEKVEKVEEVEEIKIEQEQPKERKQDAFNMSLDDLDSIQDMLSANVDKEKVEEVEEIKIEHEEPKETKQDAFNMSLDDLDSIQDMLSANVDKENVEEVEEVEEIKIEQEEPKEQKQDAFNMSLDDLDSIQDMLSANVDKEKVEEVEEIKIEHEEPKETKKDAFNMSIDDLDSIQDMLSANVDKEKVEEVEEIKIEHEEPKETKKDAFNMSLDDLDSIQDMLSANVDKENVEEVEEIKIEHEEPKEQKQDAFNMSIDDLDSIQDMLSANKEENTKPIFEGSNVVEPNFEDVEDLDDSFFELDETNIDTIDFEDVDIDSIDIEDIDTVVENVKNTKKKKANGTFDFSLDDLENIEKSLTADEDNTEETLSYLEQALINGEDISDFDVKEALNSDEDEDEVKVEFFDEKEIEEIATIRKVKNFEGFNLQFDLFEKVRDGLILKSKGEPIPFATISEDSRSDEEILNEVQVQVNMLMNDQIVTNSVNDELIELEQMLLSQNKEVKEKSDYVFEEVEDDDLADLEGFVEVDDIDDDDNVYVPSKDDEIQDEIDNIVKNFKENAKDGVITESTNSILDIMDKNDEDEAEQDEYEDDESEQDESDMEVDEFDLIEKQIKDGKESPNDEIDIDGDGVMDTSIEELDSLISEVVGESPKPQNNNADETDEADEEDEEEESIYKIKTMDTKKYDEVLVREYEALRLDLELFFPGTQDLDNLSSDIDKLLASDELENLSSITGINFDGIDMDVEELTDKDITDALLDMREIKEKDEKRAARLKNRKRRREKMLYYLTLGNRVRVYDTLLLVAFIFTAIFVINAWFSVQRNKNIAVNVQSRSEQVSNAEELWDSIYDLAVGFIDLQREVASYNEGQISSDKVAFELESYVNQSVEVREKFEAVGLPTYSEYKYKIDEFLATRMLASEDIIADVNNNQVNTQSIREFLEIKTDINQFDSYKEDFFKKLNLN